MQGAARTLVSQDVPVDRFMTDPKASLAAETAGDLLGTPLLLEVAADQLEVGGDEAAVAPGAGGMPAWSSVAISKPEAGARA